MGISRRRERDQVAAVARRRMALLEAELAGLRPPQAPGAGHETGEPGRGERRTPGQHRQQRAEAAYDAPGSRPPALGQRPPLRPGRPGMLDDGDRSRPHFGPAELFETAPLVARDAPEPDEPPPPTRPGVGGWLTDRLPETLRGRVGLSGRAVVGLVLLTVLALGAVAWTTLRSGGGDPVPEARVRSVAGSQAPAAALTPASSATASGSPGAAPTGGEVVVDVAGKVRRPGIVTLPAGSRVHEAVQRAGGARPGVSLTSINLARVLVDGEQIVVGAKGAAPAVPGGAAPTAGASGATGALVDINTADATALDTLPGVGEVTAQKILDYRTSHGGFTSVDQLLDVDGIGDKTLADIKPHVTV